MKIISGGQTGADRAALDGAIELGMDYGGSIPKGRKAEDGPINAKYDRLTELPSPDYEVRTERNVIDSDATLIFTDGAPTGGTAFTVHCARKHRKPYLLVDFEKLTQEGAIPHIREWLNNIRPGILNVAGPRESKAPGIYQKVLGTLKEALKQ